MRERCVVPRFFRTLLAVVIALALCLPVTGLAFAGESGSASNGARMADTATIIKDGAFTASTWEDYGNDLFTESDPHLLSTSATVDINFNLDYDPALSGAGKLSEGDTLSIALKPVGNTPDLMRVYWGFEQQNSDVQLGGTKIADLSYPDSRAMVFTFVAGLENVKFHTTEAVHLGWSVDRDAYAEYFKKNPAEKSVTLRYQLYVNDQPVPGKTIGLIVKNGLVPDEAGFVKTSGLYQEPQEGDVGFGSITYSIFVSTKLDTNNEFVFYDTPDVNQRFDGNIGISIPETYKGSDGYVNFGGGNHYVCTDAPCAPAEEPMEIWIYDVYFTTEKAKAGMPRQSGYDEVTLEYPDRLVDGAPYTSDTPAAVPRDILLEKPMGEALSADEQALIDEAGGLNEVVGKGFKVRIKNFHGVHSPGGFITMTYSVNLVNNSPTINDKGNPVFRNTASYYGQEIPIAPGKPVNHEGSTLDAVIQGKTSGAGVVIPSGVIIDGDKYGTVSFVKKGAAASADAPAAPLAGAQFTVYYVDDQGARTVAENEYGVTLENLVTNAEGKLCAAGSQDPVDLTLKWGSYVFVETAAPKGYVIDVAETHATVGFIPSDIEVINALEPTGPEIPGGGETPDPGTPDPEVPDGGEAPGIVPGDGDAGGAGPAEPVGRKDLPAALAVTGDGSAPLIFGLVALAAAAAALVGAAVIRRARGEAR